MKRSLISLVCMAAWFFVVPAGAQPRRAPSPRLFPVSMRPGDSHAIGMQAPPSPDSLRRDSIGVVHRDSAFVDSTSRDSLKHPRPSPSPPPRRRQPPRPRPRVVSYG